MKKNKHQKTFYSYNNWREIQRNQLGTSANLYFIFSSAIFGFTLSFFIAEKEILHCIEKVVFSFSLIFILISLLFHAMFTENRLKDFRKTAQLIFEKKSKIEVRELTRSIGIKTWCYYNLQRYSLFVGFLISLIGFSIYLFK